MKSTAPDDLLTGIRKALNGEVALSPRCADRLLRSFSGNRRGSRTKGLESLTNRELEVFELLGRGLRTKAVAPRLGTGRRTRDEG